MAKIQTIKINNEVVYPRTIKQAIVDLQGTPTIITNDGTDGDALAIKLTDNGSYQRTFRIDMTAEYTGGSNEQRIGSLIIECYSDATDDISHGYYYGDEMSDILTEVAVYQDDIDPDTFYLMLTHKSDLDSVTFAISPTDSGDVDAIITNAADDHTKVDDATISPVGGGGDGKIGVISQTQTWSGTGSNPRTYVMSNLVTGLIPQANIDLFEAAGAVFNESTGYFELNGLTDISYEEMSKIYAESIAYSVFKADGSYAFYSYTDGSGLGIRTALTPRSNRSSGSGMSITWTYYNSVMECLDLHNILTSNISNAFRACAKLRRLVGLTISAITTVSYVNNAFLACSSLETLEIKGLKLSIDISASSVLSKDSLLYIINNEASTSAITITLHASVYAKCQSGGEWYSDISTALAAHTNVSLASA